MKQNGQKHPEPKHPTSGWLSAHNGPKRNAINHGVHAESQQQAEPGKGSIRRRRMAVLMGVIVRVRIGVSMLTVSPRESEIMLMKMKQPK